MDSVVEQTSEQEDASNAGLMKYLSFGGSNKKTSPAEEKETPINDFEGFHSPHFNQQSMLLFGVCHHIAAV